MKTLVRLVVVVLLCGVRAEAQRLTIRNAPQGVTAYADPSEWPLQSGQCQWMNNTADMWHTHAEFATKGKLPGAPIWAELGNQTITVPVTVQVRATAGLTGSVPLVWGEYANHATFPVVMDEPLPLLDDLSVYPAAKIYAGHAVINLADAAFDDTTGLVPLHGWTHVVLKTRTQLNNGDRWDNATGFSVYSVIDRTQPEAILGEGGIQIKATCDNSIIAGVPNSWTVFGTHLVEVSDQSIPILAPISQPLHERVNGYNYSFDLPADPPQMFTYEAVIDANAHVNPPIPGVKLPSQPFGGIGNFDTIDPLFISQSKVLAGNAPNQHALFLKWTGDTSVTGGFVTSLGDKVPSGVMLTAVLKLNLFTGPNPQPAPPLVLLSVPAVVGLPIAEAEAAIVNSGFRVGDVSLNDISKTRPDFAAGRVWSQDPAVSSQGLPPGTLIDIGVATGGGIVVVPPPPPPPTCVPPAVLTNGQCVTPVILPPPPAPTIVSVTSCQEVTLSNGAVETKCVHAP